MSITQGIQGGGSWSGSHTLTAFPSGPGWRSVGRGNLNFVGFATNRQIAMALVFFSSIGPGALLARGLAIRGLSLVTKPMFWVGVNAFEEAEDAAAYIRGEDMGWQLGLKGRPVKGPHPLFGPTYIPVPFPYLDFTRSPSSGGGGPGELPTSTTPPPSIEEAGGFIVDPPLVRDSSTGSVATAGQHKKPKRCPPGMVPVWSHRKGRYVCMAKPGTRYRTKVRTEGR